MIAQRIAILVASIASIAAVAAAASPELEEAAIRAAAARVAPSSVRIEVIGRRDEKEAAAGAGPSTGIVVGAEGWIATSSFTVTPDVVEVVVVTPDGRRHPAKVVGRDLARLIVILKIDADDPLPVAPSCPKREIRVGQWAIALGRAWTAREASIAVGIVSAVDRGWGRAVQTDAAVSPANYGGPLVDIEGRVIGMLAPIPADTAGMKLGTELYDSGIGFAVPMEDILERLPEMQGGRTIAPGLLGISYTSRDPFTEPPVIATARGGSPAAKAGLRPADRIVAIDGTPVSRIAELRHALARRSAGDPVTLVIERTKGSDGDVERLDKTMTLVDELPPYRRPCLGIGLVRSRGADDPDGNRVAWTWPGGPAAKAGLERGDVIESVEPADEGGQREESRTAAGEEQARVKPPTILAGTVAGGEVGGVFRVTFSRGGERRTVELAAGNVPVGVPDPWLLPSDPKPSRSAVERLEAADVAAPATVIMPDADRGPLGVLVVLGAPRKDMDAAAAARWKEAAAASNVAVVIPAASNPLRWAADDIPNIAKSLELVAAKRPVDRSRIAVAGFLAGGPFAWTVAESLGGVVRGVAILDGGLPRLVTVGPSDPGRPLTVLLADVPPDAVDAEAGRRRLESDVARLEKAGVPVGRLAKPADEATLFEALCRWVETLGVL